MDRLFYENSVSYLGHLIIPFVLNKVDNEFIYSYTLLSELGHKGLLHKLINPDDIYTNSIVKTINLAKKYLEKHSDVNDEIGYFNERYTYNYNLIIIHRQGSKCFYDHYPPNELNNIAAPKIFASVIDCINWVKQGLEQNNIRQDD